MQFLKGLTNAFLGVAFHSQKVTKPDRLQQPRSEQRLMFQLKRPDLLFLRLSLSYR